MYRKQEIINILENIYKTTKDRKNISDIVMDVIGKYSETRRMHKNKATYISKKAADEFKAIIADLIKKKKSISKSDIHSAIGKLTHDHMTPKHAIFKVFENRKNIDREFIEKVLETCSATCIITNDENRCLMRDRHPHLDGGNFDENNFKIKERYKSENFRDGKKNEDEIEVKEFALENFVNIKTNNSIRS